MPDLSREYVARGGEVSWIAPCEFQNGTLYGFAVKADRTLVNEMFTRYIGQPSLDLGLHIDVRATTLEHVLFVFLDSERHQVSKDPGSEGRYDERLFAVVAVGYRKSPDRGLVLFVPYLFASDTPGWEAEREIYGYPRQQATLMIEPSEVAMPQSFRARSHVIRKFAPDAMAEDCEFLSIVRSSGPTQTTALNSNLIERLRSPLTGVSPRGHSAATIVSLARHGTTEADVSFFERSDSRVAAIPSSDGSSEPLSLLEVLSAHTLPMLFLKQFRDIAFSDRACYQAIVEAPFEFSGALTPIIGQRYVLNLREVDAVPIGRELGIPTDTPVDVDFAFRADMDQIRHGAAKVISNPAWNPATEVPTPGELPRLPMYVDRGGEAVWRQPSLLFGARIYGFGVTVGMDHQQTILDRYINNIAGQSNSTYGSRPFHLRPCSGLDMVMLLFVEYERITSGNADDKSLGGVTYREFLATQLAISDDPEYPELDWFIPYICLNVDSPRLGGREIFGYPKQLGTIDPFERYGDPKRPLDPARRLMLQTTVIRRASNHAAERNVVVVEVNGPAHVPTTEPFTNPQEMLFALLASAQRRNGESSLTTRLLPHLPFLAGDVDGGVSLPGPGVDIVSALLANGIGDVFLKEFRDSGNPKQACYQAVCKTDTIPATFHGGGCVDPTEYEITIQDLASEPLLSDVLGGGGSGRRMTLIPQFAYWLDLDLELTAGRVIANPLAAHYPYSPDVSLKTTMPKKRERRVSSFAEPFWER
jgi:hypothetical protein